MPRYDEGRLVRLLRLLRAVPEEWIRRAQRIPLERAPETALRDRDVRELGRKLEREPSFRQQFDADPVAAAEAAGLHELSMRLQREIRELVAFAERVANDEAYRVELAADPIAALGAAGFSAGSAEPLLQVLGAPTDVLAKLPEVEAHALGGQAVRERLLLFLLASKTFADEIRAIAPY